METGIIVRRLVNQFGKFIDFPSAIAGAVIMGLIVGAINFGHGWWPAATAAMKQATYTFLFGGMMIKLLYVLAGKISGFHLSIILSSFVVTVITVLLVFAVHSMRGTPMPMESTMPTAILAPFGCAFLAYRRKKSTIDNRLKNKETA
jgi:hypothetical protein